MATHLYLEQYLDSLESLPAELRRNFTLMHDLVNVNNLQILFWNVVANLCLFAEIKWYFVQKKLIWTSPQFLPSMSEPELFVFNNIATSSSSSSSSFIHCDLKRKNTFIISTVWVVYMSPVSQYSILKQQF